jgi:hypothetical protein
VLDREEFMKVANEVEERRERGVIGVLRGVE